MTGASHMFRPHEDAPLPDIELGQVWRGPANEKKFHRVVGFDGGWVITIECDEDGTNDRGYRRYRGREKFGIAKGYRRPAAAEHPDAAQPCLAEAK